MNPTNLPILFSIQVGSESAMMCSAKACDATFSLVRIIIFNDGSTVISAAMIAAAALVFPAPNTPLIGQSVLPSSNDKSIAERVAKKWPSRLWTRGWSANHNCFSSEGRPPGQRPSLSHAATTQKKIIFAGPYKGLHGLAGPCSRLFFVFLCIIFTVQQLCGPQAPPDKYLWNPSDIGYQIARRRNFFRNFDDVEGIPSPTLIFGDHFGPLLRQDGEMIPLAPLLRTRDTLPNGIIRTSWTLYQPHALVWNYAFWNGKANFAKKMAVGTKNIPQCQFEAIIPPPFLEQWKAFLKLLSSRNFQGSDVDAIVLPLVPMFHTGTYNLPFRILKEMKVIQLSGLQDFWNNVSLSDVELVPETLLRNMCGNCFHPDLISSALGSNTFLKSWANGEVEGSSKLVMNQAEAYAVFSELCEQIEKEAKKRRCKKFQLDKTLPPYEVLHNTCTATSVPNIKHTKNNEFDKPGQPGLGLHQRSFSHGAVSEKKVLPQVSQIHPSTVLLPKKVKVTKEMRFAQHCVAAASQLLTPQQTSALKNAGMQSIFAALRAPVNVNFQFKDYITKLIGVDPGKLQKMSSNPESQCPDLLVVEELRNSFKRWEQQPGVCSIMAVCIAAAACKAGTSWPLGHVLLLPNGAEVHACHVGAEKPKLLFLVDCKQCEYPLVTVVAATVDSLGLPLGTLRRVIPVGKYEAVAMIVTL